MTPLINSVFLALTTFTILIDSYFHPKASDSYFFFDSKIYLLFFVSLMLLLKTTTKQLLPPLVVRINRWIFPFIITICLLFIALEKTAYETYVLNTFHFHYEEFLFLGILSGFILYLQINPITKLQKLTYSFGPAVFLFFVYIYLFDLPLYRSIVREDGPIEMFQFCFYVIAAFVSLLISQKNYKKQKIISAFYFMFFLGLCFISLEEIAWGQRLFGFTTPETLSQINNQNEITFHNIKPVESSIHFAYIAIGIWGVFGRKFIDNRFAPSRYLTFYFFIIAAYFIAHKYAHLYYDIGTSIRVSVPRWQELSELFLAMGVFFFMIEKRNTLGPKR